MLDEEDKCAKIANRLRNEWQVLLRAEKAAAHDPQIALVVKAVLWRLQPLIRLVFMVLDDVKWDLMSARVRKLLEVIFEVLPDSKIVEDTHQHLRDLQRAGRHNLVSNQAIMNACIESGVIEGRKIQHLRPSDAIIVDSSMENVRSLRQTWDPATERLQKKTSTILKRADWPSPTPLSEHASVAAWQYVKHALQAPSSGVEPGRQPGGTSTNNDTGFGADAHAAASSPWPSVPFPLQERMREAIAAAPRSDVAPENLMDHLLTIAVTSVEDGINTQTQLLACEAFARSICIDYFTAKGIAPTAGAIPTSAPSQTVQRPARGALAIDTLVTITFSDCASRGFGVNVNANNGPNTARNQ